jgi:hypothetical protein
MVRWSWSGRGFRSCNSEDAAEDIELATNGSNFLQANRDGHLLLYLSTYAGITYGW